jgi:hypothetical protein
MSIQQVVIYFVLAFYFIVASIKLVQFIRKLVYIKRLISSNTKTKEQHYWIVSVQNPVLAFSFFRYIFINRNLKEIDKTKFEIIKRHEFIHVDQLHSLDNILFEIFLILFWFNPVLYFCKKCMHETHEFIVDEKLTQASGNKKEYSHLLLNLAIQNVNISPFLGFSAIKINKRIHMLNKQKSKTMKKVSFLLIIPLMATMLLSFSVSDKNTETHFSEYQTTKIEKSIIGKVIWEGNTAYSDAELSKALGLHSGEEYNFDVDTRLNGANSKILSMYMDNGYVFYHATHKQTINNKIADITITIEEHTRGVIGKIAIEGNTKVSDQKIFSKLKIKQGDLFNRSAIHQSTDAIDKMKNIKFKNIHVLPEHGVSSKEGFAIIDLEFIVAEE